MSRYRSIVPRTEGISSTPGESSNPNSLSHEPDHQQKRPVTKAACEQCRRRKSKCNGLRPVCSACRNSGDGKCTYEVEAGQTRFMAQKEQLQDLKDIISEIAIAHDKETAISVALKLHQNKFRNIEQAASSLRHEKNISSTASDLSDITQKGDVIPAHSFSQATATTGHFNEPHRAEQDHQPDTPDTGSPMNIDSSEHSEARDEETTKPAVHSRNKASRYWFEPLILDDFLDTTGNSSLPVPVPLHFFQIINQDDDRSISARYSHFINIKRQLIKKGNSAIDVLGSDMIDPAQLLDAETAYEDDSRSLSFWANDIVREVKTMCTAEKLATALLISSLARWQISPTLKHYQSISTCMRPTPYQITIAHPAWIDYIPWPEVRDYFIRSPPPLGGGDVGSFLARHTHINWPSTHDDMLCLDTATNSLSLSGDFEQWANDINNWSLDRAVEKQYPTIATMAWVKVNRNIDFQEDMEAFQNILNFAWDPTLSSGATASP